MYDRHMEGEKVPPAAPRDTRLTYDDFLLFPDDGRRHEIKRRLFERGGVREYWLDELFG